MAQRVEDRFGHDAAIAAPKHRMLAKEARHHRIGRPLKPQHVRERVRQ